MNHYEFESKLPVDHVLHLVSMVRSGELVVSQMLICSGSALGELGTFIESFQLPKPVGMLYGETPVDDLSLEECCNALETLLVPIASSGDDEKAIDPTTIALIIQLVLRVLELWRNR